MSAANVKLSVLAATVNTSIDRSGSGRLDMLSAGYRAVEDLASELSKSLIDA